MLLREKKKKLKKIKKSIKTPLESSCCTVFFSWSQVYCRHAEHLLLLVKKKIFFAYFISGQMKIYITIFLSITCYGFVTNWEFSDDFRKSWIWLEVVNVSFILLPIRITVASNVLYMAGKQTCGTNPQNLLYLFTDVRILKCNFIVTTAKAYLIISHIMIGWYMCCIVK